MNKLDSKVRSIWLLRNLIAVIFIVALVAYILFSFKENLFVLGLSLGIPTLLVCVLLIIWPFLSYKKYEYYYDDERIIIKHGVIFRHEVLVPICQIQDLHTYQGPFMMAFKISGIIISTAGSNHTIAGVKSEDSQLLVKKFEELLNKRMETKSNEEV